MASRDPDQNFTPAPPRRSRSESRRSQQRQETSVVFRVVKNGAHLPRKFGERLWVRPMCSDSVPAKSTIQLNLGIKVTVPHGFLLVYVPNPKCSYNTHGLLQQSFILDYANYDEVSIVLSNVTKNRIVLSEREYLGYFVVQKSAFALNLTGSNEYEYAPGRLNVIIR